MTINIPIGCDRKSIFHGVVNFPLVHQVKPLTRQLLRLINKVLPEPDKQNTIRPNSHVLIALMDYFFANENNPNREAEFQAIAKMIILMFDGDYYYWERMEHIIAELYKKIQSGEYELRKEPPRATWWGHHELCSNCGQVKGSNRIFADCPVDMHK